MEKNSSLSMKFGLAAASALALTCGAVVQSIDFDGNTFRFGTGSCLSTKPPPAELGALRAQASLSGEQPGGVVVPTSSWRRPRRSPSSAATSVRASSRRCWYHGGFDA